MYLVDMPSWEVATSHASPVGDDDGEREEEAVSFDILLPVPESPDQALKAWQEVYEGLSEQEIVEIENIALDRGHFMRQEG